MLPVAAFMSLVGYCTSGLRLLPAESTKCVACIYDIFLGSLRALVCNCRNPQYPKQSYPRYTHQPNVRLRKRCLQLGAVSSTHLRYWRTCRRLCRYQWIPNQKIKQPKILIPLCIDDKQRSNFPDQ